MRAVSLTFTIEATEATILCIYPRLLGQHQRAATKGHESRRAILSDKSGSSSHVAYADSSRTNDSRRDGGRFEVSVDD